MILTTHREIQDTVGTPGLGGMWNLEEGTGAVSTADNSGNGHDAAMTNFEEGDWRAGGPHGLNYLRFDSPRLTCLESGNWAVTNADLTWMAWVRIWTRPNNTYWTILSQFDAGNSQRAFYLDARWTDSSTLFSASVSPNGLTDSYSFRNSANPVGGGAQIPLNTWIHVAARYKQSTQQVDVLLDGVNADISYGKTLAAYQVYTPATTQVTIGSQYLSGVLRRNFYGFLTGARVYSQWLSDQEILDIVNGLA